MERRTTCVCGRETHICFIPVRECALQSCVCVWMLRKCLCVYICSGAVDDLAK
jgi:hypothetical protein